MDVSSISEERSLPRKRVTKEWGKKERSEAEAPANKKRIKEIQQNMEEDEDALEAEECYLAWGKETCESTGEHQAYNAVEIEIELPEKQTQIKTSSKTPGVLCDNSIEKTKSRGV